jgi:hypothetical protein
VVKEYREMLRDHKVKKQSSADDKIMRAKKKKQKSKPYIIQFKVKPTLVSQCFRFLFSLDWELWNRYSTEKAAKEALKKIKRTSSLYSFRIIHNEEASS